MNKIVSFDDLQQIAERHGGKCLSDEYLGLGNKLLWECLEGHTWEARPRWVLNDHWCPKCAETRRGPQSAYTIEKLKDGFDQFFSENGHYPSAHEIDKLDYLPSSRQIQRAWGGLQELRKKIGLSIEETNHNKGIKRSKMASTINSRGKRVEDSLEIVLIKKFGEISVHSQQVVKTRTGMRLNVDFFVYTATQNFCVDTFWSSSSINSKIILRNKINKYSDLEQVIYLVETNPDISEQVSVEFINGSAKKIPKHIFLETLTSFQKKWGLESS